MKEVPLDRNDLALLAALAVLALAAGFTGLGSRAAPRSYWTARADEVPVADARTVATVDRLSCWIGLGEGAVAVEASRDGAAWERVGAVEQPDSFGFMEWRVLPVTVAARYLRLVVLRSGLEIGEVGAFAADGTRIVLAASGGPRTPFDEQDLPARTPTARTGMYFDETYFARSAWEGLRGMGASETSHPPLGRRIIAIGIALWGMNPFGWRFMGALAGALAVPLLYLVARRLDLARPWGALAALLFLLDFLRFAQSRMATVDTFAKLFALLAAWFALEGAHAGRPLPWMVATGLALGAGLAVKWSAAFPAAGVAVIAIAVEARCIRAAPAARRAAAIARSAGRLLACMVFIPLVVYVAAWLPDALAQGWTPGDLVARHLAMYRYHAAITETRWYASAWWQWPLDLRPIWLYRGTVDVAPGRFASVVTMGNPALWWPALVSLAPLAVLAVRRDRAAAAILVLLAASWLPWAAAARRLTFIYHFLPAVPWLVLGLVRALAALVERAPRAWPVPVAVAFATVVAFAAFLPILAGIPVPLAYADALRWLPTWIFHA